MELFTDVHIWQIFVVIGLILTISEIFIPGFVMLPLGLGFLIASVFVEFTDSHAMRFLILAGSELIVLGIFMKYVRPKFVGKETYKSNADSMIGKTASVIQEISADSSGYVKLYGDEWKAITKDESTIAVGKKVEILEIDGIKVIVKEIKH